MKSQIRLQPLLAVFVGWTTLHAVTMGLIFGEVFPPYWWMAIVTGVSCALGWVGKQELRARRRSAARRYGEVDAVR